MSANMLLSAVQLVRAASDLLLGADGAPVYIEQHGPVLLVSQGDDHACYAPSGALLERTEIGLREEGARPEEPAEPEPDVFYVGEEHAPPTSEEVADMLAEHHDADPRKQYHSRLTREIRRRARDMHRDESARLDTDWARWVERLYELEHWAEHGAPSREMIVMYAPAAEQPGPSVLERIAGRRLRPAFSDQSEPICECGATRPGECGEYGEDLHGMSVAELSEEADAGCRGAQVLVDRRRTG